MYILKFFDIKNVCIVMKSYHWSRQYQNYNTIYPAADNIRIIIPFIQHSLYLRSQITLAG